MVVLVLDLPETVVDDVVSGIAFQLVDELRHVGDLQCTNFTSI